MAGAQFPWEQYGEAAAPAPAYLPLGTNFFGAIQRSHVASSPPGRPARDGCAAHLSNAGRDDSACWR